MIPSTSQVICNSSLTSKVIFSGTATSYSWTNSLPSIGLIGSGTGNISSFTALNPSSSPVTSSIVVTPIFTGNQVSCTGPTQSFTYTVNPTPIVNDLPDQTVCNGTSVTPMSFTGTGTSYNWSNNASSIGLVGSGSGNISSFSAINTSSNPISATLTVTPQFLNAGVNCIGSPEAITITVNPTPIAIAPINQVYCNGQSAPITNIAGTATGYSWINSNAAIGLAANGTGNIPAFIASNTGFAPITSTITITPHYLFNGEQCDGLPVSYTIIVNPTPIVNIPVDQTVCNGTLTAAIVFQGYSGTTYNWTNSMPGIGLAASGTGDITAFTGQNNGTSPLIGDIEIIPEYLNAGLSCFGLAQTFSITVNPSPVVGFTAQNQVICSGANTNTVNISTTTPNANITWNVINAPAGISGLTSTSGTNLIPSFSLVNTTSVAQTIQISASAATAVGGCPGSSTAYTITVNPAPTVAPTSPIVVCNGNQVGGITFSGTGTGYTWTNNLASIGLATTGTNTINQFTAVNSTASIQTAIISVTPVFLGNVTTCNGSVSNFTITINPTPVVNPVADFALCNNQVTSPLGFTGTGIYYTWASSNTSMGLSAASGTNGLPSFTAINGTGAPISTTISIIPLFVNANVSCTGSQDEFVITVNPTPIVNDPLDQVSCNLAQTAVVNFGGTGTNYTWTNTLPSIGLAASGSGNILAFTALNSGSSPVVATVEVTPEFVGAGANCFGSPQTFSITVNPTPSLIDPIDQTVCNGASTALVNLIGTGTSYSWINNAPSIGLNATGIGNISPFTAVNLGSTPISAQVIFTPLFEGSNITCPGPNQTMLFTVNPTPIMTDPSDQVVCDGSSTQTVNFVGSATSYSWINALPSIGLGASGLGNISSFSSINIGSVPLTGTITVTPVYTGGQVSCTGPNQDFNITVNPSPIVNDLPDQTVCNGSSTNPLNFTGSGTSYSWTNTV